MCLPSPVWTVRYRQNLRAASSAQSIAGWPSKSFFHTAGLVRGRKYIRGSGPNGERGLIPEIGLETPGNPAWEKCIIVDGSRRRRHSSNRVKRQWYARHRAIRFSRRFLAAALA